MKLTVTLDLCCCLPDVFLPSSPVLVCLRFVVTLSSLYQTCSQRHSSYFSAAVLNVAPRAPYQRHAKNSWEQLNTGFNSSPTTEVKSIAQCIQMDVASKEQFSYHKLSADPNCIPKLTLSHCGTIRTYDKHIYPASQTRPLWNSKPFLRHIFYDYYCWN